MGDAPLTMPSEATGAYARVAALARALCTVAMVLAASLASGDTIDSPTPPSREVGPASVVDHDGDGVCDGRDILDAARAYVSRRPRYQSSYVDGGRPGEGSGVCTDVVDQALLGAGYDLRALVDEDARMHPSAYPAIDIPDPNIDFRRVANQRVWFSRHALACAVDPLEVADWQAGDIVCWPNHIGIVSDRRDPHGVALVVHHSSCWQVSFEEDILVSDAFGEICGHWRMGVEPG